MIRKVTKAGIDTLTISLPRKWAREYDLSPGADIQVDVAGPVLTARPTQISSEKDVEIELKEIQSQPLRTQASLIRTIVGSAYKAGYDNITLHYSDKNALKKILQRTELLMGLALIATSEKSCVIKRILKEDPAEYPQIKRKFFYMILHHVTEFKDVLSNKQKISNEDVANFRANIEKISDFLKRLLIKNPSANPNELKQNHVIVNNLEKIAREYIYLVNYVNEKNVSLSKATQAYFKDTLDMLESFRDQYYDFDLTKIYALANKKNELLFVQGYKLLRTCDKKETPVVYHLMSIVKRIWDMGGPLVALNLKRTEL
ncbi:hypothetical protein KY310_04960 [Candidatus Woesearchaeota archaeon]|nr:hypothetical protein [Candidatus Woesearchaeota archaeon]